MKNTRSIQSYGIDQTGKLNDRSVQIMSIIDFISFLKSMDMSPYELAKIIRDVVNYQQNEIDTYKIVVIIETILIVLLSCELA